MRSHSISTLLALLSTAYASSDATASQQRELQFGSNFLNNFLNRDSEVAMIPEFSNSDPFEAKPNEAGSGVSLPNIDTTEVLQHDSLGGLLGHVWGGNHQQSRPNSLTSQQVYTPLSSVGEAAEQVTSKTADISRLRLRGNADAVARVGPFGKGKGKGKGLKAEKSKGKGKGKGCKKDKSKGKGDKKDKSKGKGKGSKKDKSKGTIVPSTSPSESPSVSMEPSAEPSESLEPSEEPSAEPSEICPESEEPTSWPTVSAQPSVSGAPSSNPSVSFNPTQSAQPSVSGAPTSSPSESLAPSSSSNPTATPVPGVPGLPLPACLDLDAFFDNGVISLQVRQQPETPAADAEGVGAYQGPPIDPDINTDETDAYDISVKFYAERDSNNVFPTAAEMAATLDESVSDFLVLHLACPKGGKELAQERSESFYFANRLGDRRLEDGGQLAVLKKFTCTEISELNECDESNPNLCRTECTTVGYFVGVGAKNALKENVKEGIKWYIDMLTKTTSWYPLKKDGQEIKIRVKPAEDGAQVNAATEVDTRQAQQGMKAGPFIGAATGALALLLLLVLFVRRRKRQDEEEVSHLKLDEDDTYYDDDAEGDSTHRHEYTTRDIHVVGEGDSVISHWTGYTGANRKAAHDNYEVSYNKGALIPSDVHACSSATCDLCSEERKNDVRFIKTTGTPVLPVRTHSLPSNSSREYAAEDTVEL